MLKMTNQNHNNEGQNRKMKFKVIELDWTYRFDHPFKFEEMEGWTSEDYYQYELKEYKKSLQDKPENIYDNGHNEFN